MAKDYYQTLGVNKNASAEEIKRAYRKLAHEHHPDKNRSDGEKFKEINEAYQILSDPIKRSQYDQFGSVGEGFGGFNQNSRGFDPRDFSGFSAQGGPASGWGFGGGISDIFEDLFSGAFSQVQSEVEISLTTALLGETIHLRTNQGEEIVLRIPPGTADGTTFRFRGKGMPTRRGQGDLLLTVRVRLPRRLTSEQKRLLEELKRQGL